MLATVVDFETRNEVELKVIDGTVKLKKDGTPKNTHSNAKTGGSTWVDPIREKEDIKKILDYINRRITEETRKDYVWQWERNKMYFCIAVFSGFRVCDLVGARPGTKYKNNQYPHWTGLKWSDVYEKDGKTFKDMIELKELKTGHMRKIFLSNKSKEYIADYVEKYHPNTKTSEYMFLNRQKNRLSAATIDDFIKEVTRECGIYGNYSTHSLRKTCVYHMYQGLCEKNGEEMALAKCIKFTGHKSIAAFLSYLGLDRREKEEGNRIFEEYWGDTF